MFEWARWARALVVVLCFVYLALVPVCFIAAHDAHMGHDSLAVVARHAAMYQSFVAALIVCAAVAVAFVYALYPLCAVRADTTVVLEGARRAGRFHDPGLVHRGRFVRWLSLLLLAPPRVAL